jgi:hypothetical protein
MKILVGTALVACSLIASVPATGFAQQSEFGTRFVPNQREANDKKVLKNKWRRWEYHRGIAVSEVPELDPGMAGSAIALLLAASALMYERRRRAATGS